MSDLLEREDDDNDDRNVIKEPAGDTLGPTPRQKIGVRELDVIDAELTHLSNIHKLGLARGEERTLPRSMDVLLDKRKLSASVSVKVTPRKDEVKAVVEMLESTAYNDGTEMAKDIIKRVGELFAERDWYALAWRDKPEGGLSLAWGPLSSETEANRFGAKLAVGGEARGVKLYSTAQMLETIASQSKGDSKDCTTCGHPHGTHRHERQIGKCQVRGCKCKTDTG